MDAPTVAVLIPTFNRLSILVDTIDSLHTMVMYGGKLEYYVGVDSDKETTDQTTDTFLKRLHHVGNINVFDGPRRQGKKMRGYLGANLNMLYAAAVADGHRLFLQMDDDHQLIRALDLQPHVDKLLEDPTAGWIRLMGVGFHKYCGCLEGNYWRVRWDSPEAYIPSNRPHLKEKRFHDVFGGYPEDLKLGETEEGFCMQCKDMAAMVDNPPCVMVPITVLTESSWNHVGISLQGQGE